MIIKSDQNISPQWLDVVVTIRQDLGVSCQAELVDASVERSWWRGFRHVERIDWACRSLVETWTSWATL